MLLKSIENDGSGFLLNHDFHLVNWAKRVVLVKLTIR